MIEATEPTRAQPLLDAVRSYAAGVLHANSEMICRVVVFPQAGQTGGDCLILSCADMGILISKRFPHARHSNS